MRARPCLCTISGKDRYIMRVENFNYVHPNPVIKMAMIKNEDSDTHTCTGAKKIQRKLPQERITYGQYSPWNNN